jgi:hypothetical protein
MGIGPPSPSESSQWVSAREIFADGDTPGEEYPAPAPQSLGETATYFRVIRYASNRFRRSLGRRSSIPIAMACGEIATLKLPHSHGSLRTRRCPKRGADDRAKKVNACRFHTRTGEPGCERPVRPRASRVIPRGARRGCATRRPTFRCVASGWSTSACLRSAREIEASHHTPLADRRWLASAAMGTPVSFQRGRARITKVRRILGRSPGHLGHRSAELRAPCARHL